MMGILCDIFGGELGGDQKGKRKEKSRTCNLATSKGKSNTDDPSGNHAAHNIKTLSLSHVSLPFHKKLILILSIYMLDDPYKYLKSLHIYNEEHHRYFHQGNSPTVEKKKKK